jgi:hypothetical protein
MLCPMITPCPSLHLSQVLILLFFLVLGLHIILIQLVHGPVTSSKSAQLTKLLGS